MKIGGFLKNSFIDYKGHLAAVVFTSGCNFNCWYCHNNSLIASKEGKYEESEILDFLKTRIGQLDGVVISGGEPTLQEDLEDFIIKIKKLGYDVKLDTNGTNSTVLKELIDKKLIDYVAMDIKTELSCYEKLVQKNLKLMEIKKSIELLQNSGIMHEFRTTFSPDITTDNIINISKLLEESDDYYLQKCNLEDKDKQHDYNYFLNTLDIIKKSHKKTYLRY